MNYNAFISYRHTEPDMYVAKQIHKRLETFKVPRNISRKNGKKIQRVFRDQEELPIGSDLGDNITKALQNSEYLIVICSPRTPESYWVQTEIDTFIKMHGRNKILAVLVEGEPNESFPQQLLVDETGNPVEPLAADVRGKSRSEINKKLKTEVVRLAAPLLGCSYDELKQRHRERRLKKVIGAAFVIAMLAVAFGVYSVYNYFTIKKNYNDKLVNQSKYLAKTAVSLLEQGDRITAGLIALEALPVNNSDRPLVTSAQFALSRTLYAYETGSELVKDRLLKHDLPLKDMQYCQGGDILVTVDMGGNVYVWDINEGLLKLKTAPQLNEYRELEKVLGAMVTKENKLIIVTEDSVKCLDLEGSLIWKVSADKKYENCLIDVETESVVGITEDSFEFIDVINGKKIKSVDSLSDNFYESSTAKFNKECSLFAVAHYVEDEKAEGEITVYNLKTGENTIINTKHSYIMGLDFTSDNNIAVISRPNKSIWDYTDGMTIGIEKKSLSDNKMIWDDEITINYLYSMTVSYESEIKCREYTDASKGNVHSEVILFIDNTAYTYDAENGKLVSKISVTNQITTLMLSASGSLGFVVENDGKISFYNMTTGEQHAESTIEIGQQVTNVLMKNGVLAATRSKVSPDVILMKYHEGYGMEKIAEYEIGIMGMDYSENETYYIIKDYEDSSKLNFYCYTTSNNEMIMECSLEDGENEIHSYFADDNIYVILTDSGKIFLYNIQAKTTEVINPDSELIISDWVVSDNGSFAMAYDYEQYYLVDLNSKKIIADGNVSEYINYGIISNDGKNFYGSSIENKVFKLNFESGEIAPLEDMYGVTGYAGSKKVMAISSDGRYLAVGCIDNTLRIWDTEEEETVSEVQYAGQNDSFLKFIPDDNVLVMQGDTKYLKVYDIEKETFVFISDEQYNNIVEMVVDSKTETISLNTYSEMLILNTNDFELLAFVKNGLAYMPLNGYVFSDKANTLYRFPYMDLEMLIEDANKQFKGNELTERERTQYNID